MFLFISIVINLLAFLFIKYLVNTGYVTFSMPFILNMLSVCAFCRTEPTDVKLLGIVLIFQIAMYIIFGLMGYSKACSDGWYDSNEQFSLLDDIKATMFVFGFIPLGILVAPFAVIAVIICLACVTYDGLKEFSGHIKRNWDELVGR